MLLEQQSDAGQPMFLVPIAFYFDAGVALAVALRVRSAVQACGGSALRAGRSAAFAVTLPGGSEEAVAVVAELRHPLPKDQCASLCAQLKQACWQEQGVQLASVYLCKVRNAAMAPSNASKRKKKIQVPRR
jgi:hypothetical protein